MPAETFREAAERILGQQVERLARLRPGVFDAIGDVAVDQLRTADIARAHAAAVEQRRAADSTRVATELFAGGGRHG